MSKQYKEQDRVLLRKMKKLVPNENTKNAVRTLLESYSVDSCLSGGELNNLSWEITDKILAKAREAVKGAGLTDEEITKKEINHLIGAAMVDSGDYLIRFARVFQKKVAEARTQAILKALGGAE